MNHNRAKVAFFTYNLGSYSGAAGQALLISKHLHHPVVIINIGTPYLPPAQDGKVINVSSNGLLRGLEIARILRANKIGIAHFHGLFPVALATSLILRKTVVIKTTLDGDDDYESIRQKRWGNLLLWMAKSVDANIVLSQKNQEINARYLPADRIHRIPNGVEIPLEAEPLQKKDNLFCFVGLICERKNTAAAIKHFAANYAHLNGAELHIAGPLTSNDSQPEFSAEYIQHCRDLAIRLGIEQRVVFRGQLSKAQLKELYTKAKALLLFSHHEGMPNVVLEAMSHNCVPIISSMDGVADEMVGDTGGIICTATDIVSIEQIDSMVAARQPYRRAIFAFSVESTAATIDSLYESL